MVIIKLQDILNKEDRSLNWVSEKTGIAYSTLYKLNKGNTKSISFETLANFSILKLLTY